MYHMIYYIIHHTTLHHSSYCTIDYNIVHHIHETASHTMYTTLKQHDAHGSCKWHHLIQCCTPTSFNHSHTITHQDHTFTTNKYTHNAKITLHNRKHIVQTFSGKLAPPNVMSVLSPAISFFPFLTMIDWLLIEVWKGMRCLWCACCVQGITQIMPALRISRFFLDFSPEISRKIQISLQKTPWKNFLRDFWTLLHGEKPNNSLTIRVCVVSHWYYNVQTTFAMYFV